jgi:hypothetical protein
MANAIGEGPKIDVEAQAAAPTPTTDNAVRQDMLAGGDEVSIQPVQSVL